MLLLSQGRASTQSTTPKQPVWRQVLITFVADLMTVYHVLSLVLFIFPLLLILFWKLYIVYFSTNDHASLCCFSSECQGVAALSQEPAEAPPTVERGPPSRPPPSSDEPPPEKEKGDAERERPDSETESDVDDPLVQFLLFCFCFTAILCKSCEVTWTYKDTISVHF